VHRLSGSKRARSKIVCATTASGSYSYEAETSRFDPFVPAGMDKGHIVRSRGHDEESAPKGVERSHLEGHRGDRRCNHIWEADREEGRAISIRARPWASVFPIHNVFSRQSLMLTVASLTGSPLSSVVTPHERDSRPHLKWTERLVTRPLSARTWTGVIEECGPEDGTLKLDHIEPRVF